MVGAANTHAPKFVKLVRASYRFEEVQSLIIRLFDIDSTMHCRHDTVDVSSQDFIGEVTCHFAQIMSARGSLFRGPVVNAHHHHRSKGTITVVGEEVKNCNAALTIQLACERLENKVRSSHNRGSGGSSTWCCRRRRVDEGCGALVTRVCSRSALMSWYEVTV